MWFFPKIFPKSYECTRAGRERGVRAEQGPRGQQRGLWGAAQHPKTSPGVLRHHDPARTQDGGGGAAPRNSREVCGGAGPLLRANGGAEAGPAGRAEVRPGRRAARPWSTSPPPR